MPENAEKWERICAVNEIGDPGAFGFKVYAGEYPIGGFVIQTAGEIHGYRNTCPHQGRPLDWAPHRFLSKDRTQIICAAHGAVFEMTSGLCVAGPCLGRSLKSWPLRVEGGAVFVAVLPEPQIR